MKKLSQKKSIRIYLEAGGKLTPKAARNFWGCDRLASRIWEIQQDYYKEWAEEGKYINKTMVKTESGAYVAQYYLKRFD